MAGTSWDKLGQMDAAFEEVAPAIRKVAQEEGVKLHEFFRDDPVWRLDFARNAGGQAVVDVAWSEDAPGRFTISASWWVDDYDTTMRRQHREEIGVFQRSQSAAELEAVLRQALQKVDSWDEAVLDQESGPYPDWQKYQTREDFQRIRLPRR